MGVFPLTSMGQRDQVFYFILFYFILFYFILFYYFIFLLEFLSIKLEKQDVNIESPSPLLTMHQD